MVQVIPYGPEERQHYLFHNGEDDKNVLIAIHGGAWRDPNNTSKDFDIFASEFNCHFYSIDYRLSPENIHPTQLNDVTLAINQIINSLNLNSNNSDVKITLIGHSVGSTLICQYLEAGTANNIDRVILLDGIYSIKDLINRYPDYESFVLEEFTHLNVAFKANLIDDKINANEEYHQKIKDIYKGIDIHVVYSDQDELLDWGTSKIFIDWLEGAHIEVKLLRGEFGVHENVYTDHHVSSYIKQII